MITPNETILTEKFQTIYQKSNKTIIPYKEIDVDYMVNGTQKLNNKKDIINQIINILSENNLNNTDSNEILRIVSKKLGNQKVMKI